MDYTLAEYISPNYEKLGFNMIRLGNTFYNILIIIQIEH